MIPPTSEYPVRTGRRLVASLLLLAASACGGDSGLSPPDETPPDPPPGPMLDEEGTWVDLAPLPVAVSQAAVAAYRGAIYVTGGGRDSVLNAPPSALVQRYEPAADEWTRLGDLPYPVAEHAMTVLRDTLLILGGQISESGLAATSEILAYDPDSDTWNTWGHLPLPLRQLDAVTLDGRALVLGGFSFVTPPGDSITIIEDRNTWRYAPPPTEDFGIDIVPAVVAGRAYVLTTRGAFGAMYLFDFDPTSDTWSTVPAEPVVDVRVDGANLDGRFHILGDGRPSPKHRVFVPGGGSRWLSLTPPEATLQDRLVVGLEGRLYVFGGHRLGTQVVTTDAFAYVPPP